MDYRRTSFGFELPEGRIAQNPAAKRSESLLLVAEGREETTDSIFNQLGSFLRSGDCLVLNQTRVMNARCFAQKENGLRIEVFILDITSTGLEIPVLLKPARRLKVGMKLFFPKAGLEVDLIEKGEFGRGVLAFSNRDDLFHVLEKDGEVPLPPYIKREAGPTSQDLERYQTVFARDAGAVAAPTAGLHFTEAQLQELEERGVQICKLTHHVGIGTFKPISVDDIREHKMDSEYYVLADDQARILNAVKEEGRRLIAVGTTSTRCLESCIRDGRFHPGPGQTDLYIYPPYQFKAIDGLITNFHLPGSTLMLLVSALMGHERIMQLYEHALRGPYRFYSYGDAMLLLP